MQIYRLLVAECERFLNVIISGRTHLFKFSYIIIYIILLLNLACNKFIELFDKDIILVFLLFSVISRKYNFIYT